MTETHRLQIAPERIVSVNSATTEPANINSVSMHGAVNPYSSALLRSSAVLR